MNRVLWCLAVPALLVGMVACPPQAPTPAPGPDAEDAASHKSGTCSLVCDHMKQLSCPGFEPTKEGHPCTEVCQNILDSGIPWNLGCRMSAKTCAAIDACN